MSEQEIKPGQVWRRKRDGRHIRIVRRRRDLTGPPADDWLWKGEDYKGRGVSYGSYIRRDYELIEQGGEGDA